MTPEPDALTCSCGYPERTETQSECRCELAEWAEADEQPPLNDPSYVILSADQKRWIDAYFESDDLAF